jgi:pimeloyl-ACP methyl ester carboxylesterase
MWAPDYPMGIPERLVDPYRRLTPEPDAVEQGHDTQAPVAPNVADDPAFRDWWDRSGNPGTTPAMARVKGALYETDVRGFLPQIRVRTAVTQRADHPAVGVGPGRHLAEHIAGAKYVELPGPDIIYWVADTGPVLDEIEEFLTGIRGGSGAERVLAAVCSPTSSVPQTGPVSLEVDAGGTCSTATIKVSVPTSNASGVVR